MQKIKINIIIKHIKTKGKIKQYFALLSYSDYFLEDSYAFYRALRDYMSKFWIKDATVNYWSPGLNQYEIHYSNREGKIECPEDIDEFLDFTIPSKDERICFTCEHYNKEEEYCDFYNRKKIARPEQDTSDIYDDEKGTSSDENYPDIIPKYCFYWSEK